jgi:plastocyanin
VIWTADAASKHKDSEATGATTMLFQMNGSLKPSSLTVKVGEVFTFGLADGVSDIVTAKVGCDSGQTVLSGAPLAAEYLTKTGTYDVVNVVTNAKVGTITVK